VLGEVTEGAQFGTIPDYDELCLTACLELALLTQMPAVLRKTRKRYLQLPIFK